MGCFSSGQSGTSQYKWQDPLGPTAIGKNGKPTYSATGAPQIRSDLFDYLRGYMPDMAQAGQQAADYSRAAGTAPGWGAVQDNASRAAAGDYLHGSPELDRSMAYNRATALGEAQDQNARTRADYARNGLNYSTGNQQAQEGNAAAAGARASETNANVYGQNYGAERGYQTNAGNQLATGYSAPLSYLSNVSSAYEKPLGDAGNLLSALSTGGQALQTGSSQAYSPSAFSNIANVATLGTGM